MSFVHDDVEILDPVPGRQRMPGGGRKPRDYVKSEDVLDFEKARARHEAAKAANAELDLKIKTGEYVERVAVRQACATALASLAQTLRSLPDTLERKAGATPEQAKLAGEIVDNVLSDLADEFEMMSGPDEL